MIKDQYLKDMINSEPRSLAAYIHLPWCVKKCPYCDFNSHQLKNTSNLESYTSELLNDIDQTEINNYKRITSIFIGGGTPSLFDAFHIEKMLTKLEDKFSFSDDIEITIEANPNSSDYLKFRDYFSIGINRISIGAQSFNNKHLIKLGRAHKSEEVFDAYDKARDAGFRNINLDIMHGLPEQSQDEAMQDLAIAIKLSPEHISWYQLTIEPNTAFAYDTPKLPDEDLRADTQDLGHKVLKNSGFNRIEISAFAKANMHSRHNMHVWGFNDYIGFGAGAHSKITVNNKVYRQFRHYHPKQYINYKDKIAEHRIVPDSELLLEYLLNRARVLRPISKQHLYQNTKMQPSEVSKVFVTSIEQGILIERNDSWELSELGLDHFNTFLSNIS